ncbi:hypothetical protein [Verrucosispora sioxanthis]|uniref:Uncharacterized protein n=1 Tax=Verrucosispora sioxanthis TaxID=2499994 RepID=A0A6M1L1J3_9ACTN|nr:hypothetical protein [Verrucosispora sioxanthis]NEE65092.1 hypothetical protein [Verrucosispora sioxanthis]NGM14202.1 hypothetical protein [Verrucosispora sioxanthis]
MMFGAAASEGYWSGINRAADLLGIISAAVAIATLLRVQRIARARKSERELLSKALRLQDLNSALAADAETLDGTATPRQQEIVKADLLRLSAELDAATRILVPEVSADEGIPGAQLLRDGYWTDAFADDAIRRVSRRLYIVTWRNSRALAVGFLEAAFRQLQRHASLEVHVLAVACDAEEQTYQSMSKMLTLGNSVVMRREQQHYRDVMVEVVQERLRDGSLKPDVACRFKYYETRIGPVLHCIIADDEAFWGINFFMDPGAGATELLNRAYLRSSTRTEFGRKVLEQVEILRNIPSTTQLAEW